MGKASTRDGKVINLSMRQPRSDSGIAFGASVERGDAHALPANEQVLGLLSKIIIDESLPYYVAALDGTVMHTNELYNKIDSSLGEMTLAPGAADCVGHYQVPSLKPVIDDVCSSNTTVRSEEITYIGGRERVFLGRHLPVRNERGEIIAVAGTYEDVTAQVRGIEEANKTQARFQDFARASSDWFFECDSELRVRSLSDRFTAIVGQPASLFIGSRFEQFGRLEANLEGRAEGVRALQTRKPFRDQLFIICDPSGSEMKFHLSGVPVFDRKTGSFEGYRGVGMDVSSRYEQAQEQSDARDHLERLFAELTRKNIALDVASEQAMTALRAKNEFLAAMSHELRTPLNAIIGFAETFEQETFGALPATYIEYASDIRKSGHHLLGLINDILDVAVIESGGLSLTMDAIPVEQIVEKAVHMNVEAAKAKSLDVKGLDQSSHYCIHADDRRATQILVNLLSNAIKFTPEGGAVGIEYAVTAGKYLNITVWDTGIGITPEQQARVFEKFHQVTEHIYSRQQEGTGLGLHISRELARRMKGDLTLESEPGKGSRFTVRLPLASSTDVRSDII